MTAPSATATPPKDRALGLRHLYQLIHRFEPSWKPYALAGVTAVGTSLCEAGTLILLTLTAASVAGGKSASHDVLGMHFEQRDMLILAGVLLAVRLLLTWLNVSITSSLAMRCLIETRRQVMDTYVAAGWEQQSRLEQGLMYDLLGNRAEVVAYSSLLLCGVIVSAVNLMILAAAALALQPIAVLGLGLVGGLVALVLRPLNRRTRRLSLDYLRANLHFLNRVTDLSHNARDLAAFGVGAPFMDRVMVQQTGAVKLYRRKTVLLQFTPQAYQTLGLGLAVGGLAFAASAGSSHVATLGAVVLLLLRGISHGQALMGSSQAANERIPWVSTMIDVLEELDENTAPPGTQVPENPSELVLHDVGYSYDEQPVLLGIDLVIPMGQRIGVVGPSGSGKSTLIQILAGLRRPDHGSYRVGEVEMADLDPTWWAKEMALVSQDAKLLTDTVAENIAFLRELELPALELAASKAQLADEVEALGGYDTALSREGRALSGGQMQRLSIARALAGDPAVLLLDEPTSALDVGTEARLQKVLAAIHGKTTMVIVAHRLATVSSCDRIIVLDAGRIIADGPPSTVLEDFGAEALSQWELVEERSPRPATPLADPTR